MANSTKESNGLRLKREPSEPPKPSRTPSAAPISTKLKSIKKESTTTDTKITTAQVTNVESSKAVTESEYGTPMATSSITNVSTTDVSEPSTLPKNIKSPISTVSLYALRYFFRSDEPKLQAVLTSKLVKDFEEITRITSDKQQNTVPIVFHLSMDVQIDADGILYIVTKTSRFRCTEYHLCIEKPSMFFISSKYHETIHRPMSNNIPLHTFLFDLQFSNDYMNSAPGKFFE